ncbi:MAG: 30S ribosomal protein S16 [Candidatus Paceibacterota bacterium]|jgi:small subunit ribosomal protein S16
MLVIRFFRTGKINQPSFKIVVTEKTNSSTRGRFVEQLGTYNPTTKEKTLNAERAKYWIGVGAQPSETVHNLFVSEKIIEGKKVDLHKKSKKAAEAKPAEAPIAALAPEAPSPAPVEVKSVEPAPIEIPVEKPAEEKKPEEAKPETAEVPKTE